MPSKTSTLVSGQGHHFSKAETRRHRQRVQDRKSGKSVLKFKEPIYLHKSRDTPQIGDLSAPDQVCAHEFDDSMLPKKLLPRGQERRGCKTRDVDLRIKRDNKAISGGGFQGPESKDCLQGEAENFV